MTTGPDIYDWNTLLPAERESLLQRPELRASKAMAKDVADIIARVRAEGDSAVRELTLRFDGVQLGDLRVGRQEFAAAAAALTADASAALDTAIANVRRFHEAQVASDIDLETMPGVRCQRVGRAIDAVGLYVPAGSAPLPSAAIMLAVPAAIAGCRRKLMCTPPRADGSADPAVLVAAERAGVDEVYKIGGAQAIAALACGTESLQAVNKIFGPGNAWVTAAKTQLAGSVAGLAIDMPAGPSEVLVIADDDANPGFVAADLLSQAEHGPDSQVILLTTSHDFARAVQDAVRQQLAALSRATTAAASLQHSRLIVCEDIATAVAISNRYAPEHLILQTRAARDWLPQIVNAGSVFLGPWTPEAVGDYCSGTNHVLPTYGAARSFSGLGVEQFMRQMTVQELTRDGLRALAPAVSELARLEGLDAHAAAVTIRMARAPGDLS